MGHIGMKYSLVTRDLIADSTEAMALAHQFVAVGDHDQTVELVGHGHGLGGIGNQAVSYTHLDVYKRQERD